MNNRNLQEHLANAQRIQQQLAQERPSNSSIGTDNNPQDQSVHINPQSARNNRNSNVNPEVLRAHQAATRALNIDTLRQVHQETQQMLEQAQQRTAQQNYNTTERMALQNLLNRVSSQQNNQLNSNSRQNTHDLTGQISQSLQSIGEDDQSAIMSTQANANGNSTNYTTGTSVTTQRLANDGGQNPNNGNAQNQQWPPYDLYQQIDALIQQSHSNLSQAQQNSNDTTNQNLLQQIIRQANGRRQEQQNQQASNVAPRQLQASVLSQQQILDQIQNSSHNQNTELNQLLRQADSILQINGNNQRVQSTLNNRNNVPPSTLSLMQNRDRSQNSQSTLNEENMHLQLGHVSQDSEDEQEIVSNRNQQQNRQQRAYSVEGSSMSSNISRSVEDSKDGEQEEDREDYAQQNLDNTSLNLDGQSSESQPFGAESNSRMQRPGVGVEEYSVSDDDEDEDGASNTSHEENMDTDRRQQMETSMNLRALGINSNTQRQINNTIQNNIRQNREDRLQGYPMQDDIDENDDVVSMSESPNHFHNPQHMPNMNPPLSSITSPQSQRIAEIGTIQSANTRRIIEQNINASNSRVSIGRGQREENKANANQNIEEIFKCFICFGKIQDAVMCPSCSKLCCRDCIRKWLTDERQQCPHCRCHLQVHQLVNCRFVEEITAAIETLNQPVSNSHRDSDGLTDGSLMRDGAEVCKEHGARLDYYCQTCKIPICSECAMFGGDRHKDHKFLRLGEVYEKHCDVIKNEAIGLKKRLKELTKYMNDVQATIEKVTRAKEDKCKEIENFVENIQAKLNTQLKNKLLTLLSQRQSMQDEIEQLDEFHNKLNQELTKMPKSSLIKKSGDLIRQLKEIHTKEPHRFVDNEVAIDFTSELVPQYEQSVFVIKNFSRIRAAQNQVSDENEIVYSDPPLVTKSGLTWRLKVYPNGNGIAKGNYISVFLEMLKGLPDTQTQKYEYRVEMINHRNPSAQVIREFASEFEVGECWGYNRFYRIDYLDREGYLNNEDDSITLKFFVRAPYYSQHCSDQERHITNLQKQIEAQAKELEELKSKHALESHKKLRKNVTKPQKFKPSNSKNDEEESKIDLEEIKKEQSREKIAQQSGQFLKELKDKQKKNEQKMQINSHQIQQVIQRKQKQNNQATQQEEQKNIVLSSSLATAGKSQLVSEDVEDDVIITNRQIDPSEDTQQINFYQSKNQVDDDNISSEESGSNQAQIGRTKKSNLQSNSTPPNDDQQQINFEQENPYTDDKKFKMQTEECPDDSSNSNSQRSGNSSYNEEERKEREQYKILKQSLKALQERAQTNPSVEYAQNQNISHGENSDDQNLVENEGNESILLTDDKVRPQSSLAIVDNSYIQSSICDAKSNNSKSDDNEKLIDSLINDEDIVENEEVKFQEENAIQSIGQHLSSSTQQLTERVLEKKKQTQQLLNRKLQNKNSMENTQKQNNSRPGSISNFLQLNVPNPNQKQQAQASQRKMVQNVVQQQIIKSQSKRSLPNNSNGQNQ